LHNNYINLEIVNKIKKYKNFKIKESNHTICTAFGECCENKLGDIILRIYFKNIHNNNKTNFSTYSNDFDNFDNLNKLNNSNEDQSEPSYLFLDLTCTIIQSPFDIIIGRP
jgi:hypothetical protein